MHSTLYVRLFFRDVNGKGSYAVAHAAVVKNNIDTQSKRDSKITSFFKDFLYMVSNINLNDLKLFKEDFGKVGGRPLLLVRYLPSNRKKSSSKLGFCIRYTLF